MVFVANVKYVVVEKSTDKVLYVKTETVDISNAGNISEKAFQIKRRHRNVYVLIKIF